MNNNRQELVEQVKEAAKKFEDAMLALGHTFSNQERLEMRRIVPLRKWQKGVDTIDSIRGQVALPNVLAECMEEVINGTSTELR